MQSGLASLLGREAEDVERKYLAFHEKRYAISMELINGLLPAGRSDLKVLDVGPHFQTHLIKQSRPDVEIHTLGYWYDRIGLERVVASHVEFDLANISLNAPDIPIAPGSFDLIVLGEVIEHVYVAPTLVLPAFRKLLRPGGAMLVTTPNAAALSKRLRLLFGQNPFEMLRETPENPGHFREYTASEMRKLGRDAGFATVEARLEDVYRTYLLVRLAGVLMPSLRQSLFCTFRESA
jgi:SAM-dependent methyltransferase